jgi:quercetin dioxygenase-like cupin family protein
MKCRALLLLFVLSSLLVAQTGTTKEVEITAEPGHHLTLENEYIRAFNVEVPPHSPTLLHRHRHDYIFITLGDTQVENDVEGKPPVTLQLKDGETRFVPGGFAHIAKNLTGQPFRNVTIEFLKDEEARKAPATWNEERGLHVLNGGTIDIMFVKDNVRVSEVDLQPGGVVPMHHHDTPHLAVAITDIELRSESEGKPPVTLALKSGEMKWVPAGLTHTITNIGKQPARLITLEFK